MKFTKMHGAGNDFVFVDALLFAPGEEPRFDAEDVRRLCDRRFGIGADGFAVLHQSALEGADLEWTFFNNDGSRAEMCGNAARCAVRLVVDRGAVKTAALGGPVRLKTPAGIVEGRTLPGGGVEIAMPVRPDVAFGEKTIKTDDGAHRLLTVNTGVPHAVLEVSDLSSYPVERVGAALVRHPAFLPAGTNVTFFQRLSRSSILSTTFERGVEEETFACGTGVTAAALAFREIHGGALPVAVTVPGGKLDVDVRDGRVWLRGPAAYVYEGTLLEHPRTLGAPEAFRKRGSGK
jgi:diaminopimelate epimerase